MIALPPVPVLAARLQRDHDPETFVLLQAARRREGRREAAARVKRARRAARRSPGSATAHGGVTAG